MSDEAIGAPRETTAGGPLAPLSALVPAGLIALLYLALHLLAIRGFGYFRDELYYIACSDHLALGYVDQPPLSLLLLKLIRLLFGDSREALRALPALAGAGYVVLTGAMARELGGRATAALLAAAAAFAAFGNAFMFHIYSMNPLDLIAWQALCLVLLRILRTGRSGLWLVFGAIAGLGLQNKISPLFLLFGVAAGLVLTRARRFLKAPPLWGGALTAFVLFLPYLAWNAAHGWPTLEFMRRAALYKNVQTTPLGFLAGQIFYNNPLTLAVWLTGLAYFLFFKPAKPFRLFGWAYLAVLAVIMTQGGKDYYMAGIYPVLFAGGATAIAPRAGRAPGRRLAAAAAGILLASGIAASPLGLPLLTPEKTAALYRGLGLMPSQERLTPGELPQHFADEFGWEEMAGLFGRIHQSLPAGERDGCFVFVRNYGEAAALDFFGRRYGLPKASSGHNSYWFWGPPRWDGKTAIVMGDSRDVEESLADLRRHFREVTLAGQTEARFAMPYENGRPVFVCRGFRHDIRDFWPQLKNFI